MRERLTVTVEPSSPLSQCMRTTSLQRPAPTFARRGVQRRRNVPSVLTLAVPILNSFWGDSSLRRTVRLQNSITGQSLPLTVCTWSKRTLAGETLIV